jgi:hypothetical protein
VLLAAAVGVAILPAGDANAADDPCLVSDVDYTVKGSLQIKDTQFGAADGVYPLGGGTVRIRFERSAADAPMTARLMSYDFDTDLTVKAAIAFWSTTVVTQAHTTVDQSCDGASTGVVDAGDVVWRTPARGYRSDGTIHCEGNVCGQFGAPVPGASPLHESPSVKFRPFHFAGDHRTFTMPYTLVSHSDSPRQTALLALAGRETHRSCVPAPASCQP